MIDSQTISLILETARIEEVVSDFVSLKKRGTNLIGLCPFHNEKTPSFIVSPAKGIFKCFGCGKGGNSVQFVMEHEQLSYPDALRFLAKKYHIEIQEREISNEEQQQQDDRESMFAVNKFAQEYFSTNLHQHAEGVAVGKSYFFERGFREDVIKKFQLGYCLDNKTAFTQEALKNGYKKEFLERTGLSVFYENGYSDRFRGRVIFPVHTLTGKVVAFGGRILQKDKDKAKYVNSPESDIYHKSEELYGMFFAKNAIVKQNRCFLVEGYADVLSMYQAGVENVVASSGTSLTLGQIQKIKRFTDNITVIYDGDAAGIKASFRAIDLLLEAGMNVKMLLLPEGEDPDSYAQSHNADEVMTFINENQKDFIHFKASLLMSDKTMKNDPLKKVEIVNEIVRSIALISNKILLNEYVKECARLLDVKEETLYNEINRKKRKTFDEKNKTQLATQQEAKTPISYIYALTSDFEKQELAILYFLVRYGERKYHSLEQDAQPLTIASYIYNELKNDNIAFRNPLHQQFLTELEKMSVEQDVKFSRYFVNHQNPQIAQLSVELITDKYEVSKRFTQSVLDLQLEKEGLSAEEKQVLQERKKVEVQEQEFHFENWLFDSVYKSLMEYKKNIVAERIKEIRSEMKENPDSLSLLQEFDRLSHLQRELTKLLGQIIIR
ncbi:MAG: DNA primase [Paludibacteraceae bacterium]|nr:DNA primase [Paludibacteraceae bacterium]